MFDGDAVLGWTAEQRDAFEQLAHLLRSENRVAALETLCRGSWRRHELQSEVGASRPTLARILADFDDRGWVERDGHEYRATTAGRLVAEKVLGTIDAVATVDRVEAVLETVPTQLPPPDPGSFSAATVTEAEPGDPFGPVRRFSDLLDGSETFCELNPTGTEPLAGDRFGDRLHHEGPATIVVEPSVAGSLAADAGERRFDGDGPGGIDILVHESLPCRLSLFDDRIAVARYDPSTGALTTLVDTAATAARRWAERVYETYAGAAVPLTETDLPGRAGDDAGRGSAPGQPTTAVETAPRPRATSRYRND